MDRAWWPAWTSNPAGARGDPGRGGFDSHTLPPTVNILLPFELSERYLDSTLLNNCIYHIYHSTYNGAGTIGPCQDIVGAFRKNFSE